MMTEKDKKLIERAESVYTDWTYIDCELIPQAETEECRKELERLAWRAFKLEEICELDVDRDEDRDYFSDDY